MKLLEPFSFSSWSSWTSSFGSFWRGLRGPGYDLKFVTHLLITGARSNAAPFYGSELAFHISKYFCEKLETRRGSASVSIALADRHAWQARTGRSLAHSQRRKLFS